MLHAFAHHPRRQKMVDRFRRGAQAAARLKHPNILPVYDFGEWQGTFYVVMDFVEGNLRDLVEKPSEHIGDHANAGVYVFDQRIGPQPL